eukprot:scaffold75498_cov32-Attheya_sp.AAC.1
MTRDRLGYFIFGDGGIHEDGVRETDGRTDDFKSLGAAPKLRSSLKPVPSVGMYLDDFVNTYGFQIYNGRDCVLIADYAKDEILFRGYWNKERRYY